MISTLAFTALQANPSKKHAQLNTLPPPPNPLKPPRLLRGLPLPFSYNHLLFRPTLAFPLFVGVLILPAASKSGVLSGEDWKLVRRPPLFSPYASGEGPRPGEPETLRCLSCEVDDSSGRPLSGEPEPCARRLLVLLCGVALREYRGGVTYCCCSCGVAGRLMGGRPSSCRCEGVRGTSSQLSRGLRSGVNAKTMLRAKKRRMAKRV